MIKRLRIKGLSFFSILFLAPSFLIFTIFFIFPSLSSIGYSFLKWDQYSGSKIFIGLNNYINLISDNNYWLTVRNSLIFVAFALLIEIPAGFILAYLVSRTVKGLKIFRTIYFLPVIITTIAVGVIFSIIYNSEFGPLNQFLDIIGLSALKQNWLSNSRIVIFSVVLPNVWKNIGEPFIISLAAIQLIPPEILESASIDGANSFKKFTRIVIPGSWDILQICVIMVVTGALRAFEMPWALTQGGPGVSSAYISVYMLKVAFLQQNFGYGSAITVTILIYALSFTLIFKKIASRKDV